MNKRGVHQMRRPPQIAAAIQGRWGESPREPTSVSRRDYRDSGVLAALRYTLARTLAPPIVCAVLVVLWMTSFTATVLAASNSSVTNDVAFTASCDGTRQKYVQVLPADFTPNKPVDILIVLHGHGSDRWQFIRQDRPECRAVRDVARQRGMILISPDYRAKTSWMGPKAEADLVQIISELKEK
jgi:hypothetical protein